MELIYLERHQGLIETAIKRSADTGYQIICFSNDYAELVSYKARQIGVEIPQPITIRSKRLKDVIKQANKENKKFIVVDAERCLYSLLSISIDTMTVEDNRKRIKRMKEEYGIDL